MDYTELLPPLPKGVEFIAGDNRNFRKVCGTVVAYPVDQVRAAQLAAIAAAAPAIRRAERERIIAECVPGGQWCDPQRVADDIRALPEEP